MLENIINRKEYLGDGVYANFDGFQIVLTTEDGIRATNTICLEPAVMTALSRYADRLAKDVERIKNAQAAEEDQRPAEE